MSAQIANACWSIRGRLARLLYGSRVGRAAGRESFSSTKMTLLLSRAAVANEGKIHLGYMYAGDPTLSTAKTMMAGALAFAPFLERYLAHPGHSFSLSVPATYIVHRDSQHNAEMFVPISELFMSLINEAADGRKQAYFGKNLSAPMRPWSAAERAAEFDPQITLAAVSTPEIAINPIALAQILREYIAAHPLYRSALRPHDSWGGGWSATESVY